LTTNNSVFVGVALLSVSGWRRELYPGA